MVTAIIDAVSDKIKLYVDNNLVDETSLDITTFGLGTASTDQGPVVKRDLDLDPLTLGTREKPGDEGIYNSFYRGSIDEFFVFSRPFSSDDVDYFFNRGLGYQNDIELIKRKPVHHISFDDLSSEDSKQNTTRILKGTLAWSADRNDNSQSAYSPTATSL